MGKSKRSAKSPSASHHPSPNRPPSISRELVELAALFVAASIADLFTTTVEHNRTGPMLLFGLGMLLIGSAVLHRWWRHRAAAVASPLALNAQPAAGQSVDPSTAALSTAAPSSTASPPTAEPATRVWRVRATVRDTPGRLAALTTRLAQHKINIVSVQVNPIPNGAVDDFQLRAPASVSAADIAAAIEAGGGLDVRAEPADQHDLVDLPTHVLMAAAESVTTDSVLPQALRALLGDCSVRWAPRQPADSGTERDSAFTERVQGAQLRINDPEGGMVIIERPSFPFTPAEFARVRALLELDRRLAERIGTPRESVRLSDGSEVAVRPARRTDAAAVLAMHHRCSTRTRRQRYLGGDTPPPHTVDRLVSRRHGHPLVVESPAGGVVALANLLWDGDVAELAVIVEDGWQRRGIGGELLHRLLTVARDGRTAAVYAVTSASNQPMISLMRRLGARPAGIESGTVCLTIRLDDRPATLDVEASRVPVPRS